MLPDAAALKKLLSGHVKQSPESLRCVLPSGDGLEAAEEGEGQGSPCLQAAAFFSPEVPGMN